MPETNSSQIVPFDFHNDKLDVVHKDGVYYVVLARLCEALWISGVDDQWKKLQAAPWACSRIILLHDSSSRKQELRCLSIESVAGWLFSINIGKVRPELRAKLVLYQKECADVLADHFLGKRGGDLTVIHQLQRDVMDLKAGLTTLLEAAERQTKPAVLVRFDSPSTTSYTQPR